MIKFFVFLFIFCVVLILVGSIVIVSEAEVIIVERLGKYHATLGPGIHFVFPLIDHQKEVIAKLSVPSHGNIIYVNKKVTRMDLRETVYDFPRQHVITRDNVTIEINALLYFQIVDPKRATYEISNLPNAVEKLTQTTLRNVIGELDLDETLVSRDTINHKLTLILGEASHKWGVKVNRIELQDIVPPTEIREAMEKQMKAERQRRASILAAEGEKRAKILMAEGDKEAKILEGEGVLEFRTRLGEAEAIALASLKKVIHNPEGYLIAQKYLEAFKELSNGENSKIVFMPYEASSLISSIGSIKELFDNIKINEESGNNKNSENNKNDQKKDLGDEGVESKGLRKDKVGKSGHDF